MISVCRWFHRIHRIHSFSLYRHSAAWRDEQQSGWCHRMACRLKASGFGHRTNTRLNLKTDVVCCLCCDRSRQRKIIQNGMNIFVCYSQYYCYYHDYYFFFIFSIAIVNIMVWTQLCAYIYLPRFECEKQQKISKHHRKQTKQHLGVNWMRWIRNSSSFFPLEFKYNSFLSTRYHGVPVSRPYLNFKLQL